MYWFVVVNMSISESSTIHSLQDLLLLWPNAFLSSACLKKNRRISSLWGIEKIQRLYLLMVYYVCVYFTTDEPSQSASCPRITNRRDTDSKTNVYKLKTTKLPVYVLVTGNEIKLENFLKKIRVVFDWVKEEKETDTPYLLWLDSDEIQFWQWLLRSLTLRPVICADQRFVWQNPAITRSN